MLFFLARFRTAFWFGVRFKDVKVLFDSLVGDLKLANSKGIQKKRCYPPTKWVPPPEGFLKLNVDGAMAKGWDKGGIGGLIRDDRGMLLGSFSEKIRGGPPIFAELMAIKRGLILIEEGLMWKERASFQDILRAANREADELAKAGIGLPNTTISGNISERKQTQPDACHTLCDLNGNKRGHVYKLIRSQGFVSSYDIAHEYTDSDVDAHRYQLKKVSLSENVAFAFLRDDNNNNHITYSAFCDAVRQVNLTGLSYGLSFQETVTIRVEEVRLDDKKGKIRNQGLGIVSEDLGIFTYLAREEARSNYNGTGMDQVDCEQAHNEKPISAVNVKVVSQGQQLANPWIGTYKQINRD
ncbi:hypothetical protein F3Y22_tig00112738pilonHSYRG01055 [Hibiscus syriacus]|uniref:RNase H type-1 domain-containing protein n=1 Tax=Hibiscus syriacus TaxID=106335 RepID=A0A6A2WU39_HIBSY|nr:hypothetical protein F3Y22_tig00112738pilonHSYRG01055 [Hibiscus syriacus]